MEKQGLLTKAILAIVFSILLSLLWTVLEQAGVRRVLIAGWIIAAALFLVWLASVIGWANRILGNSCLVASLAMALLCVLGGQNIIQEAFPYCGDGVCAPSECLRECAKDCSAATCANGRCETALEDCRQPDCACAAGLVCVPGRNGSDERGCVLPVCGDARCDAPEETPQTCCRDCGCQPDYACEANVCYFQPPRVSFVPYLLSTQLSATTLAANPMLTDETGRPHPLVAISLRNDVTEAGYVKARFDLPGLLSHEEDLGMLPPGSERNLTWYLRHEPALLSIERPRRTNVTITISYLDKQGIAHTSTWHYPFTVLARDTIDAYGSIAFFVTPSDVPIEGRTPRDVWEEVQGMVRLGPERGLRFPAQALESGEGSARDIALVLASAYVRAGLKTSLVESEGLLVRVRDADRYVMLDPSRIGEDYDSAMVQRPGYAVHEIEQVWRQRNATVLSLE